MEIDKLWEALESITEEKLLQAQTNLLAFSVSNELPVPIRETFANLRIIVELLRSLIRENKFQLLPLTLQEELSSNFRTIVHQLTSALEEIDVSEATSQHVEEFMVKLWTYNLISVPSEFFDYARMLDHLKRVKEEIAASTIELREAVNEGNKIFDISNQVVADSEGIATSKSESTTLTQGITQLRDDSTKIKLETESFLESIKKTDSDVKNFYESASTTAAKANAVQAEIQKFFEEITKYRTDITSTTGKAEKSITDQKTEVEKFLKKSKDEFETASTSFDEKTLEEKKRRDEILDVIEGRMNEMEVTMKDQLTKATGYSLFHSFDTRKDELRRTKWTWVKIVFGIVLVGAAWNIFLAFNLNGIEKLDIAAYLKIAVSIPLAGAFWFALSQYSKERKLEEEYAFRSNVSVSLVPYKDEVAKLVDHTNPEERKKYADFVIDAIKGVYKSPTDKLFDGDDDNPLKELDKVSSVLSKAMEGLGDFVEKIGKVAGKFRP